MRRRILFLIIFLSGCIAAEKQARKSITQEERLYRAKCSLCHRLHNPSLYTYPKLERYVEKYGKGLTTKERDGLLRYLKEVSKE